MCLCRPSASASNAGDQLSVGRVVKFLISFIPSQGQTQRKGRRDGALRKTETKVHRVRAVVREGFSSLFLFFQRTKGLRDAINVKFE